jgi:hypothetical protein
MYSIRTLTPIASMMIEIIIQRMIGSVLNYLSNHLYEKFDLIVIR